MIGEVANIARGDSKVCEGLGCLVDLLVDELHVNLLSRGDGPPQDRVEHLSNRLEDSFRDIDVRSLLVDLNVDQLGNLSSRVLLGAIELESLAGRAVIIGNFLEGLAKINGLGKVLIDVSIRSNHELG